MFIISTQYKTVETDSAAFAAALLKGLVGQLKDHQGIEVRFWARDWHAYENVLYLAQVKADDVGNVKKCEGSYTMGFRSVWKA